ncbi:protein HGH1 [Cocos nucifera]|nr:protein HGH1 [Cocos nucifera]
MATELDELLGFLSTPSPQVKKAAVDIVLGLTGSDEGLVPLAARADVALPALSRLLRDPPELSVPAAEALINLSQNPTLADKLVLLGAVPTAMDMLYKNADQKVARLLIMLLANLTQLDSGSAALVQHVKILSMRHVSSSSWNEVEKGTEVGGTTKGGMGETEGAGEGLAGRVVWAISRKAAWGWMQHQSIRAMDASVCGRRMLSRAAAEDTFEHVASILVNISKVQAGRKVLLDPKRGLLKQVIHQFDSTNPLRKKGVSGTIRNCCFEADSQLQNLLLISEFLWPALLLPVAGNKVYSDEDRSKMPLELGNALSHEREPVNDPEIRKQVLEAIYLISLQEAGRRALWSVNGPRILQVGYEDEEDPKVMEAYELIGSLLVGNGEVEQS